MSAGHTPSPKTKAAVPDAVSVFPLCVLFSELIGVYVLGSRLCSSTG